MTLSFSSSHPHNTNEGRKERRRRRRPLCSPARRVHFSPQFLFGSGESLVSGRRWATALAIEKESDKEKTLLTRTRKRREKGIQVDFGTLRYSVFFIETSHLAVERETASSSRASTAESRLSLPSERDSASGPRQARLGQATPREREGVERGSYLPPHCGKLRWKSLALFSFPFPQSARVLSAEAGWMPREEKCPRTKGVTRPESAGVSQSDV